jgi:hypothetical protein
MIVPEQFNQVQGTGSGPTANMRCAKPARRCRLDGHRSRTANTAPSTIDADGPHPDQRECGVGLDADLALLRFDGVTVTDRKFHEPRKRLRRGSGAVKAEGDFAKQTRLPHSAGLLV